MCFCTLTSLTKKLSVVHSPTRNVASSWGSIRLLTSDLWDDIPVAIAPEYTSIIRTPCFNQASFTDSEKPRRPNFDAAYRASRELPFNPATEFMLMIIPPSRAVKYSKTP